jgi:hypothetical protein
VTESEYVETIRDVATAYRALFADGNMPALADPAVRRWEDIKAFLSASTAIELCETWLEKQRGS